MSVSKISDLHETLVEHTNTPSPLRHAIGIESSGQTTPATKRTFSRRASITQAVHANYDEISTVEHCLASSLPPGGKHPSQVSEGGRLIENFELEEDFELQSGKRHRSSNWPLKTQGGSNGVPYQIRPALRDRRNIPTVNVPPQSRLSKFVEGSMNDKTSQMPHPSFIIDSEDIREKFDTEQTALRQVGGLTSQENRSVTLGSNYNKSETSRPSSIVRFGKSIASAFNPSSWKIWSRSQEEGNSQEVFISEHRERAEKAYNELKQTGQLRNGVLQSHSHDRSGYARRSKHDSGVGVDHYASTYSSESKVDSEPTETPLDKKRYGRVFLDPPSILTLEPAGSLASGPVVTPKNSFAQFTKSSPAEICMNNDRERQYRSVDDSSYSSESLRCLPSRKDLLKQQKLVKRVSDLEGKLEAARRQLAEALGEPVPKQISNVSRTGFTPGGLSSLPSGGLLSMHMIQSHEVHHSGPCGEIGQAISIGEPLDAQIVDGTVRTVDVRQKGKASPKDFNPSSAEVTLGKMTKLRKNSDPRELELTMTKMPLSKQSEQGLPQDTSKNLNLKNKPSRKRKSSDSHISGDGDTQKTSQLSDVDTTTRGAVFTISKGQARHPRKLQKVNLEPVSDGELSENKHLDIEDGNGIKDAQIRPKHKFPTSEHRHLVLQKKPNPPTNNSRISRKGLEPSPPSSSLFVAVTEFSEEDSLEMKHSQECFDKFIAKAIASNDEPPVPQLPNSIKSAVGEMVTNRDTHDCIVVPPHTTFYARGIQNQTSALTNDGAEEKVESRKSFEWPADVF